MSKIAKISVIPKGYTKGGKSLETALGENNMTRYPGTGVTLFPFRENDGSYRTALDPNCVIYRRIEDKVAREVKQAEADRKRKNLEDIVRLPLDARSTFYNYGYTGKRNSDGSITKGVEPYKLIDGDNIFDLNDPMQAITYEWLRVHPRVAASLEDYNAGNYPPDTTFYVKDEEAEANQKYAIKVEFNKAILTFNGFSPEKQRKIARLCDLPANNDSRPETVYNMVDDFLNRKEIERGIYKGQSSLKVFNMYATLDDNSLYVKDLIEQAFINQLYRVQKQGRVYEGTQEIHSSKDELIAHFLEEKNQKDVLDLEKKLKMKKLASV